MRGKLVAAVSAALITLGLVSSASAALLVNFMPTSTSTDSNSSGQISWTSGQQVVANNVANDQYTAGLSIFAYVEGLGALPGAQAGQGGTEFDGVSLKLTGLGQSGPMSLYNNTVASQDLQTGTFELWSSRSDALPPSTSNSTLLLKGNINSGNLLALNGTGTAFLSSDNSTRTGVAYTGGAIYDAVKNTPGFANNGSLSWSIENISPTIGTANNDTTLKPFSSNLSGLFYIQAIPEPASLTLVMLGGVVLMVRQRRQQRAR